MEATLDHLRTFPDTHFWQVIASLCTMIKQINETNAENVKLVYIIVFTRNPEESCSEPPVQVVSTYRLHGFLEIKEKLKL